jgi:eukaryotic-like serine/threonine-protein kinase
VLTAGLIPPTPYDKRLAFKKWWDQGSVYVADSDANGTRITTPTRLTLSESANEPNAWTSDSKAVIFASNRNGEPGVFKQSLGEDTAEPIVMGTDGGTVSPDGAWFLYVHPFIDGRERKDQLMRVPVSGGPSQFVLTAPIYNAVRCARPPATLYAFTERPLDRRQLIFTAFDPMKGQGHELARFDADPNAEYSWDLSPDGTRIAVMKYGERTIHMLWLNGQARQEIVVKSSGIEDENLGWGFDWAADGRGLFLSGRRQGNSLLLHVDLRGNIHVLWEQKGKEVIWGTPSPDGRHLAMPGVIMNSNVWMMENF